MEEAVCDSLPMSRFVGIGLSREPAPDETTACRFPPPVEEHDLGRLLFGEVQKLLVVHADLPLHHSPQEKYAPDQFVSPRDMVYDGRRTAP